MSILSANRYADYDLFWRELGGQLDAFGFFVLPSNEHCQPAVLSHKHSSRRRRRAQLKLAIFDQVEGTVGFSDPRKPGEAPLFALSTCLAS